MIAPCDLDLFRFVETAAQALAAIDTWPEAGVRRGTIPGRQGGPGNRFAQQVPGPRSFAMVFRV